MESRATLGRNDAPPPAYPTTLIDVVHTRRGQRLTVRPTLPQDRDALAAFYAGLTRDTLYRRFHCAFAHLSKERLRSLSDLSQVDHQQLLMLVATRVDEVGLETIVAHAGWHRVDGESAEFALVVADAWQGLGLGQALLNALITAAARRHLRWLKATVLPGNDGMLNLARRRGFWLATDRDEDGAIALLGQVPRLAAVGDVRPKASARPWWQRFGRRLAEGRA